MMRPIGRDSTIVRDPPGDGWRYEMVNSIKKSNALIAKRGIDAEQITKEKYVSLRKHGYINYDNGMLTMLTMVNGATTLVPVNISLAGSS